MNTTATPGVLYTSGLHCVRLLWMRARHLEGIDCAAKIAIARLGYGLDLLKGRWAQPCLLVISGRDSVGTLALAI